MFTFLVLSSFMTKTLIAGNRQTYLCERKGRTFKRKSKSWQSKEDNFSVQKVISRLLQAIQNSNNFHLEDFDSNVLKETRK